MLAVQTRFSDQVFEMVLQYSLALFAQQEKQEDHQGCVDDPCVAHGYFRYPQGALLPLVRVDQTPGSWVPHSAAPAPGQEVVVAQVGQPLLQGHVVSGSQDVDETAQS